MSSSKRASVSQRLRGILTAYTDECQYPDVEEVRDLISKLSHDDITRLREDLYEALDWAAIREHTEITNTILVSLPHTYRFRVLSYKDFTALHRAARWGKTDSVRAIVSHLTSEEQLKLLSLQHDGRTPVEKASQWGHIDTERLLRDYKERAEKQINTTEAEGELLNKDADGDSSHYQVVDEDVEQAAVQSIDDDVDDVDGIINSVPDVSLTVQKHATPNSQLTSSAFIPGQIDQILQLYLQIIPKTPDAAVLAALLEQCPSEQRRVILQRKNNSLSALDVAAQRGDVCIINTILSSLDNCDIEAMITMNADTPLHIAAFWNQEGAAKAILDHLEPEWQLNLLFAEYDSQTATALAKDQKHENIVRLLESYTQVTAPGTLENLLKEYVHKGWINVSRLKEKTCKVPTKDRIRILEQESQILQIASRKGHSEVITILLGCFTTEECYTLIQSGDPQPLFCAAQNDQLKTAETILSSLTDRQKLEVLSVEHQSQTPANVASTNGYMETAAILKLRRTNAEIKIFDSCLKDYVKAGLIDISVLKEATARILNDKIISILRDNSHILSTASSKGHVEVLTVLMEGLTPEDCYSLVMSGSPPLLFCAAQHNQLKAAETLLSTLTASQKLEILSVEHQNLTVVGMAAAKCHEKTAEFFSQCQETARLEIFEDRIKHHLVTTESASIPYLREETPRIPTEERIRILRENHTILQTASRKGHTELISILLDSLPSEEKLFLLQSGAPPPLICAAEADQKKAVETWLSFLSDEEKVQVLCTKYGSQTAFDVATRCLHENTASFLSMAQENAELRATSMTQEKFKANVCEIVDAMSNNRAKIELNPRSSITITSGELMYQMTEPRGRVCIISNTFGDTRHGAEHDYENMESMFTKLGFTVAGHHGNFSAQQIVHTIHAETQLQEEISWKSVHEDRGMFVLVISSHGTEGHVCGSDDVLVKLTDIYDLLSPKNFTAMKYKPKLIIIQACGGAKTERLMEDSTRQTPSPFSAYEADSRQPDSTTEEFSWTELSSCVQPDAHEAEISVANLLIMQSSFDSFLSWREPDVGSQFIRAITATFLKYGHVYDMEILGKIVQGSVNKYGLLISERHRSIGRPNRYFAQMPKIVSTLTDCKKLYLQPGVVGLRSSNLNSNNNAVFPRQSTTKLEFKRVIRNEESQGNTRIRSSKTLQFKVVKNASKPIKTSACSVM